MHHDDVVRRAIEAVRAIPEEAVAGAWLRSLSTRDLAARSGFGAYVVLQHLPEHGHTPSRYAATTCGVCGLRDSDVTLLAEQDLAACRYRYFPTVLEYSVPVLEGFPGRPGEPPTDDDRDRLRRVLDAVRALPPAAGLSDLGRVGTGIIPSNKLERGFLLEALGYAGILCPPGRQHYSTAFVPRDLADSEYPEKKSDWQYPVRFWTGDAGVNEPLVTRYFGHLP